MRVSASEVSSSSVREFMSVCSLLAMGWIRLPKTGGRALGLLVGGELRSVTTYNVGFACHLLRKARRVYRGDGREELAEALRFMEAVRSAYDASNVVSAIKKIAKPSPLALRMARCAVYGEGREQAERFVVSAIKKIAKSKRR